MRNYFSKVLLVFFAGSIFFHVAGFAQPGWTIYSDPNPPQLNNRIRCIAIDSQNRKWIGTDWGLAIYNDTTWIIDTIGNSGLPDNQIRSIAFDPQGNAWLGTFMSGVVKYDGTNWTQYSVSNSGLLDDFVKGIAFDTMGNPWFATAGGLSHFDGTNWQSWDMNNSPMLSINLNCIAIGSNNIKYLGSQNGGMYYFDGDTTWELYNHSGNGLLPDNNVLAIALDSNEIRWIALPAQGLYAHPDSGPPGWWELSNSLIPSNAITHVMVDAAEKKYMGSQDEGFIVFDGTTFVNYKMSNSPMPDNYVLCTAKDHNGILWVGTNNGGLVRVDESLIISVNDIQKEISPVNLFPNPATSELRITDYELQILNAEIFDAPGQRVVSEQPAVYSRQLNINISSLPAGIYFLRITSEQGTLTKKFVKTD